MDNINISSTKGKKAVAMESPKGGNNEAKPEFQVYLNQRKRSRIFSLEEEYETSPKQPKMRKVEARDIGSTFYPGHTMYGGASNPAVYRGINRGIKTPNSTLLTSSASQRVSRLLEETSPDHTTLGIRLRDAFSRNSGLPNRSSHSPKYQELHVPRLATILHLKQGAILRSTTTFAKQLTASHSSTNSQQQCLKASENNPGELKNTIVNKHSARTHNSGDVNHSSSNLQQKTVIVNQSAKEKQNAEQDEQANRHTGKIPIITSDRDFTKPTTESESYKSTKLFKSSEMSKELGKTKFTFTAPKEISIGSSETSPCKETVKLPFVEPSYCTSPNSFKVSGTHILKRLRKQIKDSSNDTTTTPENLESNSEDDKFSDNKKQKLICNEENPKISSELSGANNWKCNECWVQNKNEISKCQCCGTAKPGSNLSNANKSLVNSTSGQNDDWKCNKCLIKNKLNTLKCCCGAVKPNFALGKPNFTFTAPKEIPIESTVTSPCKETIKIPFVEPSYNTSPNSFKVSGTPVLSRLGKQIKDSSNDTSSITPENLESNLKDDNISDNKKQKLISNEDNLKIVSELSQATNWKCNECWVQNKSELSKCQCCGAAKPGSNANKSLVNSSSGENDVWKCNKCLIKNKCNTLKCCCGAIKPNYSCANQPDLTRDAFKPITTPPDITSNWKCTSCLIQNQPTDLKCVACGSSKPGEIKSTPLTSSSISSQWTCNDCWVKNDNGSEKCVACGGLKPGEKKIVKSLSTSSQWTCNDCWVKNENSSEKCVACGGLKAGEKKVVTSFPASSQWTCNECWVKNEISSEKCVACGGLKSGEKKAVTSLPTSSQWTCNNCWVKNENSSEKCVSCGGLKAKKRNNRRVPSEDLKTDSSANSNTLFNSIIKKQADQWECSICLTRNVSNFSKCVCCESDRPGGLKQPTKFNFGSTTTFKFGIDPKKQSTASEGTKSLSNEIPKPEANKDNLAKSFVFGIPPKLVNESVDTTIPKPSFQFGISSEKQNEISQQSSNLKPPIQFGIPEKGHVEPVNKMELPTPPPPPAAAQTTSLISNAPVFGIPKPFTLSDKDENVQKVPSVVITSGLPKTDSNTDLKQPLFGIPATTQALNVPQTGSPLIPKSLFGLKPLSNVTSVTSPTMLSFQPVTTTTPVTSTLESNTVSTLASPVFSFGASIPAQATESPKPTFQFTAGASKDSPSMFVPNFGTSNANPSSQSGFASGGIVSAGGLDLNKPLAIQNNSLSGNTMNLGSMFSKTTSNENNTWSQANSGSMNIFSTPTTETASSKPLFTFGSPSNNNTNVPATGLFGNANMPAFGNNESKFGSGSNLPGFGNNESKFGNSGSNLSPFGGATFGSGGFVTGASSANQPLLGSTNLNAGVFGAPEVGAASTPPVFGSSTGSTNMVFGAAPSTAPGMFAAPPARPAFQFEAGPKSVPSFNFTQQAPGTGGFTFGATNSGPVQFTMGSAAAPPRRIKRAVRRGPR